MTGLKLRVRAPRKSKLAFAAAIGAAIAPSYAGAELAKDEIIVSATRSPRPAAEVGSSVTVIDAAEIEARQYQFVADALRDAVGVNIARNGAVGGFASARVRGAASGQTLVVIDGIAVNDPSAPQGGFNFANLDVVDIERIEIVRGPQSILYGADAIGGVIVITTKKGGAPASGFIEGGSYGLVRGAATFAHDGDGGDARLTVSGIRSGGISRADGGLEDDGYRSLAASFAGGVALGAGWRAEATARYGDAHAEIDGFPPPFFSLADTDETEDTEEFAVAGRILSDAAAGLSHELIVSYSDISRQNFDMGVPTFGGDGDRLSAEYVGRAKLGENVSLLAGGEYERSSVDVSGVIDDAQSGAVFALLEVKPVSTLSLSAGLRRDEFSDFAGATTARVTGAWAAPTGGILRASWGQGFRAPSLFELNFNFLGLPPNPDLRPERADGFDAGFEQPLFDEALVLKAAFFHQKIRDQIDFDFVSGGYINIDRTRARGVEVEADWRLTPAIAASVSYAFIDAVDLATGAQLARQPKHSGAATLTVSPFDRLDLSASLIANGRETDSPTANDPWARLDLRAALRLSRTLEAYGRVENATDTDYQDVSGYAEPGRSFFGGVRVRL